MINKCVIHLGDYKTGSTSLQEYFDNRRHQNIEKYSVAYPIGFNHEQLSSVFSRNKSESSYNQFHNRLDEYKIELEDLEYVNKISKWIERYDKCDCLVLSSECLSELKFVELESLISFVRLHAKYVYGVFYIKNPYLMAQSLISQNVKQGKLSWDEGCPSVRYLGEILNKFRNLSFNDFNIRYTGDLVGGDIVKDFINVLNSYSVSIDYDRACATNVRLNNSLTSEAVVFGDMIVTELKYRGLLISESDYYKFVGTALEKLPGNNISLSCAQNRLIENIVFQEADLLKDILGQDLFFKWKIPQSNVNSLNNAEIDIASKYGKVAGQIVSNLLTSHRSKSYSNYCHPDFLLSTFEVLENESFVCVKALLTCNSSCFAYKFFISFSSEDFTIEQSIFHKIESNSYLHCLPIAYSLLIEGFSSLPPGKYITKITIYEILSEFDNSCRLLVSYTCDEYFERLNPSTFGRTTPTVALAPFFERTQIESRIDHIGFIELLHDYKSSVNCNELFVLKCKVHNLSDFDWYITPVNPLVVSYHWYVTRDVTEYVVWDGLRSKFQTKIISSKSAEIVDVYVIAPSAPGLFNLQVTLVHENTAWFNSHSFKSLDFATKVVDPYTKDSP